MEYPRYRDYMRPFGPKHSTHPSCGSPCPACQEPMVAGDYTTLIPLGPGKDSESRERARMGKPYNAVAIEAHWACVTGDEDYHA